MVKGRRGPAARVDPKKAALVAMQAAEKGRAGQPGCHTQMRAGGDGRLAGEKEGKRCVWRGGAVSGDPRAGGLDEKFGM